METEADGQSVADVSTAEVTPDPVIEAEGEEPYDFSDAFAEAKAEVAAPETPTEDTAPEGEAPTEGEAAATPQPAEAAPDPTEQPATPEEPVKTPAQIREEARQELIKEQQDTKFWHDQYVDALTEQAVDPEGFAQRLIKEDGLAGFMREYARLNPDVTLEDPEPGPKQASADEVRAETRKAFNEGLKAVLSDAASRHGTDYGTLPGVAEGKLGTAIDALITKGVEAGVKAALPKALEREREALRTEIQAEFVKTNVVTPRVIGGSPATGKPAASGSMTTSDQLRASFAEAKAELEMVS